MIQMRIEHFCYECESQFFVESVEETEMDVSFCPYCGSELEVDEDLEDEDQDEEDSWD